MGLRAEAAADLRAITEDDAAGFGWPITLTDPAGTSVDIIGLANDIGTTIDPDTGMAVTGRNASVAISLAALDDAGVGIPKSIADSASKPWLVSFDDIQGEAHTFKVREALPDRAIGVVVCLLEAYDAEV